MDTNMHNYFKNRQEYSEMNISERRKKLAEEKLKTRQSIIDKFGKDFYINHQYNPFIAKAVKALENNACPLEIIKDLLELNTKLMNDFNNIIEIQQLNCFPEPLIIKNDKL